VLSPFDIATVLSNATWTPTFRKQQLARKGLSQRVQNHNQHRVARIEPVFWQCRPQYAARCNVTRESLLAAADASKQRILMVVGGHSDNAVDLCGEDNADAKRQCLGDNADAKRQFLGVKSPSENRYGSRITMSERMINTKRNYDMAPV
jgi:hypothetical protein